MKALVVESSGQPLILKTVPVPSATPGSCVVKILVVQADDKTPHIIKGIPGYTIPPNFVPAAHAIGRVAAVGPDTTALRVGQLVMLEGFIRARDDPNDVQILWGITAGLTPESVQFMADNCQSTPSSLCPLSALSGGFGSSREQGCPRTTPVIPKQEIVG